MSIENITIAGLSDAGRSRSINEDIYSFVRKQDFDLIVICDGMGGNKGGKIAAQLAVDAITSHFSFLNGDFDPFIELKTSITTAQKKISEKSSIDRELEGMGTTVAILLLLDSIAFTAHLGDSRIYLIQQNQLTCLTKDHSMVQEMVDANLISKIEADKHAAKNFITKALLADRTFEPEISGPLPFFKNDIFILCTDGLTGHVNDDEIKEIAKKNQPLTAVRSLVSLANERGGKDNITVQIAKINEGKNVPIKMMHKNPDSLRLVITIIIVVIVIPLYIIISKSLFDDSVKQMNLNKNNNELKQAPAKTDNDSLKKSQPDSVKISK